SLPIDSIWPLARARPGSRTDGIRLAVVRVRRRFWRSTPAKPSPAQSLLYLRARADDRHGAVDGERVDGGAGQVLVLDGGCDVGRGDDVVELGAGAGAEDDGSLVAPVRRVVVRHAGGAVGYGCQGQEGVGPQVACSRRVQRRPETGVEE